MTERQKGELLERAWRDTAIDLDTMVVRREINSSTWDLFAGAWNRARDGWIALIEAMDLDALLDEMLPGKVIHGRFPTPAWGVQRSYFAGGCAERHRTGLTSIAVPVDPDDAVRELNGGEVASGPTGRWFEPSPDDTRANLMTYNQTLKPSSSLSGVGRSFSSVWNSLPASTPLGGAFAAA